jgi:hypothetical protein
MDPFWIQIHNSFLGHCCGSELAYVLPFFIRTVNFLLAIVRIAKSDYIRARGGQNLTTRTLNAFRASLEHQFVGK